MMVIITQNLFYQLMWSVLPTLSKYSSHDKVTGYLFSTNSMHAHIQYKCIVISFATHTICLKRFVLLVTYSWLNPFYYVIDRKYNILFGSNSRRASLLRPHPSVILTASVTEKQ